MRLNEGKKKNPLLLLALLAGLASAVSAAVLHGTVKSLSGAPLVGVFRR